MDPRLRAAVDASMSWYDDVFALHDLPTRTEAGLWWALGPTPPWHSGIKTTEPGVDVGRILVLHEGRQGEDAVADSFGDLDLASHGYTLLIDAMWVHHPPLGTPPSRLPEGWTVVGDRELLAEWNRAHDYTGVLLPAVLEGTAFRVLARHEHGALVGGAVVHRPSSGGHDVVGLSNVWATDAHALDPAEVLTAVAALHPRAAVTDYAGGPELESLEAAGYAVLGPQRVWLCSPA